MIAVFPRWKSLVASLGLAAVVATAAQAQTVTLDAIADSYVVNGSANQNQGGDSFLRVRSSGKNRVLVRFDQGEIAGAVGAGTLVAARLELFIEDNGNNWGSSGRTVSVHRLDAAWTETGVTWNCPDDANPQNSSADCPAPWSGGTFAASETDAVLHTNGLAGRVAFDVTADVAAFLSGAANSGWLLKLTNEGQNGHVSYTSHEGTAGQAPRLVLEVESAASDETPPTLTLRSPSRPIVVGDDTPEIAVDYADGGSGVDLGSLSVRVDGADVTGGCAIAADTAVCEPPPLSAGTHVVTAEVSDLAGNLATAELSFELLLGDGPHTVSFPAVADAYLRQGSPNQNQGAEALLRLRSSGHNRALVRFDAAEVAAVVGEATVVAASLELFAEVNAGNWGSDGRTVDAHRLLGDWREGGATWNCADDADPTNQQPDCDPQWDGGAFEEEPTATVLQTNELTGPLAFDVTDDVAALFTGGAVHFGWLLKKTDEGQNGHVEYTSREGTAGQEPRLTVTFAFGDAADVTPPDLAVTAPAAPFVVGDTTPAITVAYADAFTGVDTVTLVVRVDGADVTASCAVAAAEAVCEPPPLAAGPHTVEAEVRDQIGNLATTRFDFELLLGPGPQMATFPALADAYLRSGAANQNQGAESLLRVRSSGRNRALVSFDEDAVGATVAGGTLVAATLELYVGANGDNWGPEGREVDAHRVTAAWTESGVTWNCPEDADPFDHSPDCAATWAGGTFEAVATGSALHTNGLSGWVRYDVTADVAASLAGAAGHGWLLKLAQEGQNGRVEYVSREGTAGKGPRLTVAFEPMNPGDDVTPPAIAFIQPSESHLVDPPASVILISYSDAQSGIDTSTVRVAVDGVDLTPICSLDLMMAECAGPPLTAGQHTLSAEVRDLAGNLGQASHELTVELSDAEPPFVTSLEPADVTLYNEPTPTIVATYEDDGDGVDVDTVHVFVDGAVIDDACSVLGLEVRCTAPTLAAGQHTARVTVQDLAGNSGEASSTFELVLDAVPPSLVISAPVGTVRSAVHQFEVRLDYADDSTGVDVTRLGLRVDLDDFSSDCVAGPASAVCTVVGPAIGGHQIVAEIADVAGNVATASSEFVLREPDQTPPELTIVEPAAQVLGDASPAIRLVYSDDDTGVDPAALVVTLDGVDRTAGCSAGPTEATCTPPPLLAGSHQLVATLQDLAGNAVSAELTFEITLRLPIEITQPAPGLVTRDATVPVSGTVSPAADAVAVNGQEATVTDGVFELADLAIEEGTNTITAIARNAFGGIGSAAVPVVRDTIAPRPVILTPPDGFVSGSAQVAVAGEIVDRASSGSALGPPTIDVNGIAATVEQRTFFVPDVLLVPGDNLLRVTAVDSAGNVGTAEIHVTYAAGGAVRMEELLGGGQTATVGERLPKPLAVRLSDANGLPLAGRRVTFAVTRGDGRVGVFPESAASVDAISDDQGIAQVFFTLGGRAGAGNHEVTASATGFPGRVVFCASARTGLPQRIRRIVGNNQLGAWSAEVGIEAPFPLLAQVFDIRGNPVAGVDVTYRVEEGGGSLSGNETLVVTTDAEGKAAARFRLGPEPGVNNNRVSAGFEGLTEPPTTFVVSGLEPGPEEATELRGLVLDNQDDPVPGVTLHITNSSATAYSGADGRFVMENVPVGHVHLEVFGASTSRPGTWPTLAFTFSTVSGQRNELGMPIRLLPLDDDAARVVGGPEDVTIPMTGVAGAELTVFADSATFPDGSSTGTVSVTQVHGDKVPMLAPMGSEFMLAWTVQPPGVHFDPPARISIPNLGSPPGTVVDVFSFDHDLGEFVTAGTASVTADGLQVVTHPGSGVSKGGWHGCVPPPSPGGDTCQPGQCTICVPGQKAPVPKCDHCERCNAGTCEPKKIEEVTARADGEEEKAFSGVTQDVAFDVEIQGDACDYEYDWDFGDGATSDEESPAHAYEEPGTYTVRVTVRCSDCQDVAPVSDEIEVTAVKVDLKIQNLPEEDQDEPNEENPGALILLPEELAPQKRWFGNLPVKAEEEPVPMTLAVEPSGLDEGELKLEVAAGGSKIKLWRDVGMSEPIDLTETWPVGSQPETVYVSGLRSSDELSDVEMGLEFVKPGGPKSFAHKGMQQVIGDKVKATVCLLDIVIFRPDDANREDKFLLRTEEDEPGVFLSRNRDDDNDDEQADFDDETVNGDEDRRDMSKLRLVFKPAEVPSGELRLRQGSGNGTIRVFDDDGVARPLPATLDRGRFGGTEGVRNFYIEGLTKGTVILKLEYVQEGNVQVEDSVKVNVGDEVRLELTFDDGPAAAGDHNTARIKDTLQSNKIQDNIKARFFVQTHVFNRVGSAAGQALVQALGSAGHTIEIHTGSDSDHTFHPNRAQCNPYADSAVPPGASPANALEVDLLRAKARLAALGVPASKVRPPGGWIDATVLNTYNRVALDVYGWDVDSRDSASGCDSQCTIEALRGQVGRKIDNGEQELTILFHDIKSTTAGNLEKYLQVIEDVAQHRGRNANFGLLGRSSISGGLSTLSQSSCQGKPQAQ